MFLAIPQPALIDRVRHLLQSGADVEGNRNYHRDGDCPLYHAAVHGAIKLAKLLLDHRANPNRVVDGKPILWHVIMRCSRIDVAHMMRLLIQRGANVNEQHPPLRAILETAFTDGPLVPIPGYFQNPITILIENGADCSCLAKKFVDLVKRTSITWPEYDQKVAYARTVWRTRQAEIMRIASQHLLPELAPIVNDYCLVLAKSVEEEVSSPPRKRQKTAIV